MTSNHFKKKSQYFHRWPDVQEWQRLAPMRMLIYTPILVPPPLENSCSAWCTLSHTLKKCSIMSVTVAVTSCVVPDSF